MAGARFSRKNSDVRRMARPLRTASASLPDGTQTVGPDRLSLVWGRSCATSPPAGVSGILRSREARVPSWSGLRRGGAGYWQSVERRSTITSVSPGRSVVRRSVAFSDGVLNASDGCDDPSERAEQTPQWSAAREASNATRDQHGHHSADDVGTHSAHSNSRRGRAVRRG